MASSSKSGSCDDDNGNQVATQSTGSPNTAMANNRIDNDPIKIVVVGDGAIGKTCMCVSYSCGSFPGDEYVPTVFENHCGTHDYNNTTYNITLWDTAGQEDYEKLRPLSYPGCDVFLLCFSVASQNSFQNISTKWFPEIRHYRPKAPFVLVGTKTDLRPSTKSSIYPRFSTSPGSIRSWITGRSIKESSSLQAKDVPEFSRPVKEIEQDDQYDSSASTNTTALSSSGGFVTTNMGRRLAKRLKAASYVECSAKTLTGINEVFDEAIRARINSKRKAKRRCTVS
ncbi:rho-related protein racD-like [Brevipalpus obovatus]|uniref:rho-related protein racD-like n=1 Tax=Brevipalpus obovatus TaxID=246614 RepID=UPI003D9E72A3